MGKQDDCNRNKYYVRCICVAVFFFAYRISFRHKASNASGKATDVVFSLPCALVWRVQKPNRHTNVDYVLF